MSYKIVESGVAETFLVDFLSGLKPELQFVEVEDDGSEINAVHAFIAGVLAAHKEEASRPLVSKKRKDDKFELVVSDLIHELDQRISYKAKFNQNFWIYLACSTVEAHTWRYPDSTGDNLKENMGFRRSGFSESLFGRLLIRSEIIGEGSALHEFVGQDFWRSHIMRTKYGGNPVFAIEFAECVLKNDLKTEDQREMAKAFKREHSNLFFEGFDYESSKRIVEYVRSSMGV